MIQSRCSWVGVVLASVMLIACSEDREEGIVIVADSAGVEIVTNQLSFAQLPVRTVRDEIIREISDEALFEVTAILPLSGGRLAVGVNGAGSVLLYDATGKRVSTLGKMGEGPGEFRSIGGLVPLAGDSLAVYDPRQRRLTVFPTNAGSPRVVSLAGIAPETGWSRVLPLEAGLALVGEAGLGNDPKQGVFRNREKSYRIDVEGRILATYGEFPGLESAMGSGLMGRAPFGAFLASATWRDQLIVGTGEQAGIRTYGPNGDLGSIIRWADVDRSVSQERMNQYVEFLLSLVPPEEASAMRDLFEEMPFAPQMPTHSEVLVSPEGVMWVGEYPGPEAELPTGQSSVARHWVIFGPDGVMRERVQTPQGFMPMALGDDLVWGVYQNEMDVESIRAYRLGP